MWTYLKNIKISMKLENFHEEVVPFSCDNRSQPVTTGHSQSQPVTG